MYVKSYGLITVYLIVVVCVCVQSGLEGGGGSKISLDTNIEKHECVGRFIAFFSYFVHISPCVIFVRYPRHVTRC